MSLEDQTSRYLSRIMSMECTHTCVYTRIHTRTHSQPHDLGQVHKLEAALSCAETEVLRRADVDEKLERVRERADRYRGQREDEVCVCVCVCVCSCL